MKQAALGDGLTVSAIGLGAMGMSAFYGPTDEAEAIATLQHAVAQLMGAVAQSAYAAGEEQQARIVEIVNNARREIYGILGEE